MSDKPSSSKKRSASTAGVGHSDKDSAPKRVRVDTALETRLAKLQQTLSYLDPDWKPFAPNGFMDAMILLHNRFKDMTSTKVKEYIAEGFLNSNLWTLGLHEDNLKEPISSTDSRHYKLTQDARELMTNYVTRVRDCLNALVDQAQVKPAPREFANSRTWRVYQQRSDAILCLRPADKRGLPMPLMHTAFCKFTHHFHEPPLDEHTPKYLSIADKLCQAMPSAFDSESDRRRDFEKIFVALDEKLEQHIEFFLSKKASTAKESTGYVDVAKTIDEGGSVVVLFEEFKVESTGDAYMQICRSYEVLCAETKTEPLLKFGYPAFLLCVLGMYRNVVLEQHF
ncbi:hypothetical protein CPB86DRAFT_729011 [Serendipita vermifera]|nr:hypothetical protein CPB86DRAFT_729011 [Serendipita vermifera]